MDKTKEILKIVDEKSPGLLDTIAQEDSITKEELVGKVIELSNTQMVRTHQNKKSAECSDSDV